MNRAALTGWTRRASETWDDGYPLAPRLRGPASVVLYIANGMVLLDMTIANVAIPQIAGNLGATLEQGTWVITSYAVAEAITVPLSGWLVARFGAVRMMQFAVAGFTLFSLLCGMAVTLPMLVAFRVAQGMFGGLILPLAQTLVFRIYPAPQLPRALALWMLTVLVAPAVGPIVGGAIADEFSWHWIFLINVPLGLICSLLGYLLLRPLETERVRQPVDWTGIVLLFIWVGALQFMLDTGREKDWFADWTIVVMAVVAGLGLLGFVIWELTEDHPIVDVRLLGQRPFVTCMLGSALVFGAYFSSIIVVPQWLQSVMGYSASQAGMVTATAALVSMISSQITLRLMLRIDARIIVTMGALWAAFCFSLRTLWSTDFDFFHFAILFGIQGLGTTMAMMALNNMAMSAISLAETAAGNGINSFVRTMASAVAAALVLTYWTSQQAISRDAMVQELHPDRAMAVLGAAGLPEAGQAAYISAQVDKQAVTLAMLDTFSASAIAMLVAAAAIWTIPFIDLTRLKGTQGDVLEH